MSVLAWVVLPVAFVLLAALPSATLPGNDLGARRFETPPVSPSLQLAQTFTMTADGLHALDVMPVGRAVPSSGALRLALSEQRDDGQLQMLRTATVPAADLVAAPVYRFEFAPLADSKDRRYQLDLSADDGASVALRATRGTGYEFGTLQANGRERWADLVFHAHAPVPSIAERFVALHATNPARAWVIAIAVVGLWVLGGLVPRAVGALTAERS